MIGATTSCRYFSNDGIIWYNVMSYFGTEPKEVTP